jgi:hypothetical protein
MAVLPTGIGPVTGGYQIERSLRFNSADSAYLNRTPASAGNRKTWTFSAWVKRSGLPSSGYYSLLGADSGSGSSFYIAFDNSTQQLEFGQGATVYRKTTQVFRDPSAWYHFVIHSDTTQATASNRLKIYINGIQITAFATSNDPSLNGDWALNNNVAHSIGADIPNTGARNYYSGYLTEVNFIDGSAKTPSDFGETDASTGVWKPKAYTGTYGTNGFYLKFADNSNTTAATLGKDSSGNGNNWTPNNFSVTAGAGNDSLVDTPTNYGTDTGVGGEVRGNYCTLNPLDNQTTLSNGNLTQTTGAAERGCRSTFALPDSGLWYAEATVTSTTTAVGPSATFGLATSTVSLSAAGYNTAGIWGLYSSNFAYINRNGTVSGSLGFTLTAGDVVQVAVDIANGRAWLGRNNTWYDGSNGTTGNPSSGTNPTFTSLPSGLFIFANGYNETWNANFGQRAFAYTAPSGFKALCTQNLPTPTVGATSTTQANDYMNVVTWTGNGNNTRTISGLDFQPDFVWIKDRSDAYYHTLYDAVRGVASRAIYSSATDVENGGGSNYSSLYGYLSSFNSDGFGLTSGSGASEDIWVNDNAKNYVAWNWKANGAGSSNTAGTITSTVSANTTAGFSIVTWTGTGADGTVGHGLGVAPKFWINKSRNTATDWYVNTTVIDGSVDYLVLNSAAAAANTSGNFANAPTSSVISLGSTSGYNGSGNLMVSYVFAPVAGYSAFGSYVGNGSADGTFVYTGFRPRYVLVKGSSFGANWNLFDTSRNPYNITTQVLRPNLSDAEFDGNAITGGAIDVLSNGFKIRKSDGDVNSSGQTFIYAAFAESPFKYSLAR